MKKLLCLCLATLTLSVAGAETVVKSMGGHWVPYHDVGVDRNRNGRIDRTEWTQAPSNKDRPWAQPQSLQGQTRRWDLKWVESASPAVSAPQATKI